MLNKILLRCISYCSYKGLTLNIKNENIKLKQKLVIVLIKD